MEDRDERKSKGNEEKEAVEQALGYVQAKDN